MKKHILLILIVALSLTSFSFCVYLHNAGKIKIWEEQKEETKSNSEESLKEPSLKKEDGVVYCSLTQYESFYMQLGSAELLGEKNSLKYGIEISLSAVDTNLPPLSSGMINVTSEHQGYRFLPHGAHFSKDVSVQIGYDTNKIPKGRSYKEIRTYFYNEESKQWELLALDSISDKTQKVYSRTTHFTDMINAIIQYPELPESRSFTPSMLQELEVAQPSNGVTMIESPQANSQGTAELSYPINIPAGRNGMQPNLSLSYSSEAGNGLLGMGWDMQQPAIMVDSKWGVPRYDKDNETECYTYNGQELLPSFRQTILTGQMLQRRNDRQFFPRVESNFDSLIRKGSGPDNYFWIVTDKDGRQYYYGTYDGNNKDTNVLLMTQEGNIGYWPLCKVIDKDGNSMRYCYEKRYQKSEYQSLHPVTSPDSGSNPIYLGVQLWLKGIVYSEYGNEEGQYKIVFNSDSCSISDVLERSRSLSCGNSAANAKASDFATKNLKDTTSLSKNKVLDFPLIKGDIPQFESLSDLSGRNNEEPEEELPICESSNTIDISICVPCLPSDATLSVFIGREKPIFDLEPSVGDDNPIINPPAIFNHDNNGGYQIEESNGVCVTIPVPINCSRHIVIAPPQGCNGDPISFTFDLDEDTNISIRENSENGIVKMGQHVSVYKTKINVPLACDCNPEGSEPQPGSDTGTVIRYRKFYIGAYDNICKQDLLPHCLFTVRKEGDEPEQEYFYTTGFQKLQPINVEEDKWHYVKGTYFGKNYQRDSILFDFKVNNDGCVEINGDNSIVKLSPDDPCNSNIILMLPEPIQKYARLQLIDRNNIGFPEDNIFSSDTTSPPNNPKKYSTDNDGYTEYIDLSPLPNIYCIEDMKRNEKLLYMKEEECDDIYIARFNRFLQYNTCNYHYEGNTLVYTIVYEDPLIELCQLQILKLGSDSTQISGAVFKITPSDGSSFMVTTGNDGLATFAIKKNHTYTIQEQSVPSGYILDTNILYLSIVNFEQVSITSNLNYNYDQNSKIITIYNELKDSIDFQIKKQDNKGNPILGAVFKITPSVGSSFMVTTGNDGLATFAIKKNHTYTIQEQSVPSGYILDTNTLYLNINANYQVDITSNLNYNYDQNSKTITIYNEKINKDELYLRIRTIDKDYNGIARIFAGYTLLGKDSLINNSYSNDDGYSHCMSIKCNQSYTIRELRTPSGYVEQYSYVDVSIDSYGDVTALDSLGLFQMYLNNDTLEVVFIHKDLAPADRPISERLLEIGCRIDYAYDNSINMRLGFRQSSKEKLSCVVVFSGDSCVSYYKFCYGNDFYGRALLKEIEHYDGKKTNVYTHQMDYYQDVTGREIMDTLKGYSLNEDDTLDLENPKGLSKKVKRFFKNNLPFQTSVLGSSQSWGLGINATGSVGIGCNAALKTVSVGIPTSWNGTFGKGKTSFTDINGDGLPDYIYKRGKHTYFRLQKPVPDSSLFESARRLPGVKNFLKDFSDNVSIGLTASAVVHGGIQFGIEGTSWTNIYMADMTGDGMIDIVKKKDVQSLWSPPLPPLFRFSDCNPPTIEIQPDSLYVTCDTSFSFEAKPYERDRSQEIRYDVVRVWEADLPTEQLTDLYYSICSPVHLAYDSTALENFCGPADSVIVSIEYYGKGLTGDMSHILLWSDVIGNEDTTEHSPDGSCDLNIIPSNSCQVMFRVTDQNNNPLSNIQLVGNNGLSLRTNYSGETNVFSVDNCVTFSENFSPNICSPVSNIEICCEDGYIETSSDTVQISLDTVDGEIINVITVVKHCYPTSCSYRIRKIDQDSNKLQGVGFTINGNFVYTDANGEIALPTLSNGDSISVKEVAPLSYCNGNVSFSLLFPNNCNFELLQRDSFEYHWENEYDNSGHFVRTLVVYNNCNNCNVDYDIHGLSDEISGFITYKDNVSTFVFTSGQVGGYVDNFIPSPLHANSCVEISPLCPIVEGEQMKVLLCADSNCNLSIAETSGDISPVLDNGHTLVIDTTCNTCSQWGGNCYYNIRFVNPIRGVYLHNDMMGDKLLFPNEYGEFPLPKLSDNQCFHITSVDPIPNCSEHFEMFICFDDNCNPHVSFDNHWWEYQPINDGNCIIRTLVIQNDCDGYYVPLTASKGNNEIANTAVTKKQEKQTEIQEKSGTYSGSYTNSSYRLDSLRLMPGDKLFFRVRPWNNGVKKKVVWDPQVIPNSRTLSKTEYKDENNRIIGGGEKASTYQLLQGDSVFSCPFSGEMVIESVIPPQSEAFSDTVFVEIRRGNHVLYKNLLAPNTIFNGASLDSVLQVDTNDTFSFRVYSRSNVNIEKVQWYPRLYYTYINAIDDRRDTVFSTVGEDTVYAVDMNVSPWHSYYHHVVKMDKNCFPIINNLSSQSTTLNNITINSSSAGEGYLTIKQNGRLIFSKICNITSTGYTENINRTLQITNGEPVYISLYVADARVAKAITNCSVTINNNTYKSAIYTQRPMNLVYGGLYGGWGQFLYQTTIDYNSLSKMDITKVNRLLPDSALTAFERVDTNSLPQDSAKLRAFSTSSKYDEKFAEVKDLMYCFPMVATPSEQGHIGYYPNSYVRKGDINIGGIPCWLDDEEDDEESCFSEEEEQEPMQAAPSKDFANASKGNRTLEFINRTFDNKKISKSTPISFTFGGTIPGKGISMGNSVSRTKTTQIQDMMDLNGDGYLDIIEKGNVYYSAPVKAKWELYPREIFKDNDRHFERLSIAYGQNFSANPIEHKRTGSNTNKGKTYPTSSVGGNETFTDDNTIKMLIDINGDGLPDRIIKNNKNICLNTGYDFDSQEKWNLRETDSSMGCAVSRSAGGGKTYEKEIEFFKDELKTIKEGTSIADKSFSGGIGFSFSHNKTRKMFADVNGDGLPDRVEIIGNNTLRIFYNIGCGYNNLYDSIKINKDDLAIYKSNTSTNVSGNVGVSAGFPIICMVKIVISGGVDGSFSLSRSRIDFQDINGDGFADILISPSKDELYVYYSSFGRTGLLKTVTNPLGGTITMDYHKTTASTQHPRRWVMNTVALNDSLSGDGADEILRTFEYEAGYYDKQERNFYGFAIVKEKFHDNNTIKKQITRYYYNNTYYTKGLLLTEELKDGNGNLYVVTMNKYNWKTLTRDSIDSIKSMYVTMDTSIICYYEGTGSAQIRQVKVFRYDNTTGNLVYQKDSSTNQDAVELYIRYHQDPGNHCISLVSEVEIPGYRKRTTEIDNKGHIIAIMDYYTAGNALISQMQYDKYGNIICMRSPNTTTYFEYDSLIHTYPTVIRDTFGVATYLQDYDYRFGIPKTVIDNAGNRMEYTLDNRGRILTIRGPKEIENNVPYTIKHTYLGKANNKAVSCAMTEHYDPQHPDNPIKTYSYCDGFGRIVQTRKESEVDGEEKLVISGRVVYDGLGRVIENYYPSETDTNDINFYFANVVMGSGGNTIFWGTLDPISPTRTTYDVLDRPLVKTLPDGSTTTFQYAFDNNHLGKMLFKTSVTDANGHTSIDLKDVSGKSWATKPSGRPFVYFDFNPVGDNTRVYSSLSGDWSRNYTYDQLGRRLTYTEGELAETLTYNGNNLATHSQSWLENGNLQTKTIQYTYNAHRLQSVNGQDEVPVVYHYDSYGRVDTLYDESGLVCYQYGNMGEITRETRIYTVPFLSNIIALSTQFEYDSWGRILNITYPDNEIVSYDYDCGGQLFKFYNNQNYTYLDSVQYNKFGAKISQKYGNGIQTKYTYYPLTQRLDSLLTTYSDNTLSYLQYTYDSVGNIIRVNSSYSMPQYVVTERYSYDSADQLLTAESTCNNNVLCSGAYSYNNWGNIDTFTQQTTDPATNTSENKDYRYYFPGSNADMAQGQTSFAPIIKYDMQQNQQPLETCTYGINGSIRKRLDHQTQNTDYYYFNASGNLKACGTDMQISVYGYNSANTRTYKVNLFNANQWVNGQPQPIQPMVQSAMFYPNTYLNFTQAGEYTKHYYNGTERICSRLGEQQISISVENNQELEVYQHDVKQIIYNSIGQHLYDEPTNMQEGDVIPLEFLQPCGNNNAVYYYHPNHLGSTSFVTDMQQSVVQSFLYAPYGEIITEYNVNFGNNTIPKYSFNAKELDEETGMYYYEARYYAPPTFTSRDPMFEKYFWMTPYAYCANNPVKYVDPDGCEKLIFFNTKKPNYINYRQWKKDLEQRNANIRLEQFAKNYKDHDDVIHLFAHGNSQGVDLAEKGYKNTAFELDLFLMNNSTTYQKNIKEKKTSLLIMHSCETGDGENSIAQQLSKTADDYLLVIAPSKTTSPDGNREKVNKKGSWNVYYKGEIVGKYKGDIDFQKQLEGKNIQNVIRHWTNKYKEKYVND